MIGCHKLIVEICGGKYPIKSSEAPAYVQELGRELDRSVRELMRENKSLSLNEALVLAALSYLDAYHKSEKTADHLRGQVTEYLEDAAKARLEASEAGREITRLERLLSAKGGKS